MQLQNLITSKFIAHFLGEVSAWQARLSVADQVITVWFEVQRTWMHLESIFMSSEDIRNQLPEDSARFDHVDQEFKVQPESVISLNKLLNALYWKENDLLLPTEYGFWRLNLETLIVWINSRPTISNAG